MEQRISIHDPALKRGVSLSPRSWHHPNKKHGVDGSGSIKRFAAELASARTYGLHITENCDRNWKLLNQAFRYTNTGERNALNSSNLEDDAVGTTAVEQKRIGRTMANQASTNRTRGRKADAAWRKIFDGLRDLTAPGVLLWAKPGDAYRLELGCLAAAEDSPFANTPATGSPIIAVTRQYGRGVATWKFVGRNVHSLFRAVQKSTEPRTRTRDHDEDYNEPEIDDEKIPF